MDTIANWETRDDATAEEALDSSKDDYDEFILEKLRQREDIAADSIPTKETLVHLGLENVFEMILSDLRKESEVGDLVENTLELIALYKVRFGFDILGVFLINQNYELPSPIEDD